MGLPSGLLWASCNIGAEEPSGLGLYFSWGDTEGHRRGEGYDFTQEVYNSTTAAAIASDLSLDQDAARANLGSSWRMPTATEFQELVDNCTSRWDTIHGVNGMLFISNVNGNTLFLPAAGDYNGTSLNNRGTIGLYWSSTYVNAQVARCLYFVNPTVTPQSNWGRYLGFNVRAVMPSV